MLRAVEAYLNGNGRSRDDLRAQRREPEGEGQAPPVKLPKSYELRFQPEGLPYNVSVVLRGSLATREEILQAVKDLARRIEAGEIDLENHGRFSKSVPGAPEA